MPLNITSMCWSVFRVACRSFAEGIFIYLLIDTGFNCLDVNRAFASINKRKMLLFSCVCSFIAALFSSFLYILNIYKLIIAVLVFFYFWYKQQKIHKNLIINYNGAKDIWYAFTTAVILILATYSFNSISHMLLHTFCVSTGIYDTINSVRIFRELYKTAIMFLDVFFIFLAYKFRFIKMKDIKAMSAYKRIPITFGLCLLSMVYMICIYDTIPPSIAPYRNALFWAIASILPVYIGFYVTTAYLTRLISIKTNYKVDIYIHIWLFNPSLPMFKTTGLSVYDSNTFMSNFESKKMTIRNKLRKLGITDDYKGYSELVLCLFLTSLFVGLKGWSFEKNVFWQASLIIDMPAPKLRKNIEDIIDQVWTTGEVNTLIDGYYLPYHNSNMYDQTRRPTVEQFLTDVAKSI